MNEYIKGRYYKDSCYHVYNRGVAKMPICLDEQDYNNLIFRLGVLLNIFNPPKRTNANKNVIRLRAFPKNSFDVLALCIMDNHYHFQIIQKTDIPITALIHRLFTSYTKYFNKKYNRVGHLFQDHFKAKYVSSDQYMQYLSAYIHNNPEDSKKYNFSSYSAYINPKATTPISMIISTQILLDMMNNNRKTYEKFVDSYKNQGISELVDPSFLDNVT